jgi:sulfonate transport system substrate-binding protein
MRSIGKLVAILLFAALAFAPTASQAQDRVIRVGFQKYGNLILLKGKGWLEKKVAPLGFRCAC